MTEFRCPECSGLNRVEFDPGEKSRRIACIHCAHTDFIPIPGDPNGAAEGVQVGCRFVCENPEG
jgi:DNA-directed RNA polymerase subunit RPC12/RpoP